MSTLLAGVVGSTAYGLAREGSDVDRLGVFAAPTVAFHGLHAPKESIVSTDPDVTLHEAAKFCRLALGGNPTVTELMWLSDYETRTPLGDELIGIQAAFLSAKRVRDAYLGYASQARHLYRLCHQGFELYETGRIQIRLTQPYRFFEFGEQVASGNVDVARDMLADYEARFDAATTALPEQPDTAAVDDWLLHVRREFL